MDLHLRWRAADVYNAYLGNDTTARIFNPASNRVPNFFDGTKYYYARYGLQLTYIFTSKKKNKPLHSGFAEFLSKIRYTIKAKNIRHSIFTLYQYKKNFKIKGRFTPTDDMDEVPAAVVVRERTRSAHFGSCVPRGRLPSELQHLVRSSTSLSRPPPDRRP